MKRALVKSEKGLCGSVRMDGKNPKTVWWNDEVKAVAERKRLHGRSC